jgi:hypothetical protein
MPGPICCRQTDEVAHVNLALLRAAELGPVEEEGHAFQPGRRWAAADAFEVQEEPFRGEA